MPIPKEYSKYNKNLINIFVNYIIGKYNLYVNNKEGNFYFFSKRLENKLPKGLMFVYEGINFYIKDFCATEYGGEHLKYNQDKVYVICECYDIEEKVWRDKIMHQDFVVNRFNQFRKIMEG
jgi:hypothetical protein